MYIGSGLSPVRIRSRPARSVQFRSTRAHHAGIGNIYELDRIFRVIFNHVRSNPFAVSFSLSAYCCQARKHMYREDPRPVNSVFSPSPFDTEIYLSAGNTFIQYIRTSLNIRSSLISETRPFAPATASAASPRARRLSPVSRRSRRAARCRRSATRRW